MILTKESYFETPTGGRTVDRNCDTSAKLTLELGLSLANIPIGTHLLVTVFLDKVKEPLNKPQLEVNRTVLLQIIYSCYCAIQHQ
jgi:hypothetical protein